MPDPVLYLQAIVAAAGASAFLVLAYGWARRPVGAAGLDAAGIAALGLGLAVGCLVLRIRPAWPPANGLDRYLTLIVPAALVIEWIAAIPRVPRRLAWLLRMGLAGACARVLLHRSVHLKGGEADGALNSPWLVLGSCAILLAVGWGLLMRLSQRAPGTPIIAAIAQTALCGGMAIMMAGYITGGEAALGLAAALAGVGGASALLVARPALPGVIGCGLVGLFGLLCVGKFFGGLSTGRALMLFLAPLLCWAGELPMLRGRKPWVVASAQLALVAMPLVVVLGLAKRDFDRRQAPVGAAISDSRRSSK